MKNQWTKIRNDNAVEIMIDKHYAVLVTRTETGIVIECVDKVGTEETITWSHTHYDEEILQGCAQANDRLVPYSPVEELLYKESYRDIAYPSMTTDCIGNKKGALVKWKVGKGTNSKYYCIVWFDALPPDTSDFLCYHEGPYNTFEAANDFCKKTAELWCLDNNIEF